MATLKPRLTKSQFAEKFRATFPDWTVQVTPAELMALSDAPFNRDQIEEVLRRLTALVQGQEILVTADRRAGKTIVTVDIRNLSH